MKNAAKYAENLKQLLNRLNKGAGAPCTDKIDPLKALVRAAMSFDVSDARADDAVKAIEKEFVDLNELRVATDLEIAELLGVRFPLITKRVEMITRCLNAIFEKEHTLNLDRLSSISTRDARQFLRDLPDVHPFVEAFVMLFALEAAAVPVDEEMLSFLREEEIVGQTTTLVDAQKFLEHNVKPEECRACYAALRRAAHNEADRAKKKVKTR